MNFTALLPLLLGLAALPLRAEESDAKKAHEKDVQAVLDEFKKAFKGGELERADAVKILDKMEDRKIAAMLANVLNDPGPNVRIAAADGLARYEKDPAAGQALARALAAAKKQPSVQVPILKAMGTLRDWGTAPAVIDHFNDPDLDVCRAAMMASGRIRNPSFVKELSDFLRDAGAGSASAGASSIADFRVRRLQLRISAQLALREITGQNFTDAKAWEDWWKSNGAAFTAKLQKEEREELDRVAKERKAREEGAAPAEPSPPPGLPGLPPRPRLR